MTQIYVTKYLHLHPFCHSEACIQASTYLSNFNYFDCYFLLNKAWVYELNQFADAGVQSL